MSLTKENLDLKNLQDLLLCVIKNAAVYGLHVRNLGYKNVEVDQFIAESLFSTLDNIDFIDTEKVSKMIYKANDVKNILRDALHRFHLEKNDAEFCECPTGEMHWEPAGNYDALLLQAKNIHLLEEKTPQDGLDSLRQLLLFNLKGLAAYEHHVSNRDDMDENVTQFIYEALVALSDKSLTKKDFVTLLIRGGKLNLKCLECLENKTHSE